jgi:hypothetical protein
VGAVLVVLAELLAIPPWNYFDSPVTVTGGIVGAISSFLLVLGMSSLVASFVFFVRTRRARSSR